MHLEIFLKLYTKPVACSRCLPGGDGQTNGVNESDLIQVSESAKLCVECANVIAECVCLVRGLLPSLTDRHIHGIVPGAGLVLLEELLSAFWVFWLEEGQGSSILTLYVHYIPLCIPFHSMVLI